MYARRNLNLCTKDCLCLFVCPTGATDTETGQIDKDRCLDGCRLCVDACPSHAIYLVVGNYPEPLEKDREVSQLLTALLKRKSQQESMAETLEKGGSKPAQKLAKALKQSCRIVAEDCARESGYMLPQCNKTRDLLQAILNSDDFSEEDKVLVRQLSDL